MSKRLIFLGFFEEDVRKILNWADVYREELQWDEDDQRLRDHIQNILERDESKL